MSPEEIKLLQQVGQVNIFDITILVTRSVLYGLYLAIFAFGIRALLKRSPWTKYTRILFGFLSILFLISTVSLAQDVAFLISLIRGALVDNADQPFTDRLTLADASVGGLSIAGLWLGGGGGGFLFVFADAVVVWRAYVLWPGNKIAKIFPLVLLLASLGSTIVSAVLSTIAFSESAIVPTSSPTGVMLVLSQSLSLATNVVATTLIGYKAYYHRQMMRTTMGMQGSTTGEILLFLTESGVAFCVLQVISIATSAPDNEQFSALNYATTVWQEITLFAAAAYPVLVLIIVDSHRSISDHTGGSAADSGAAQGSNAHSLGVGSHISFAARTPPGISSTGSGGGLGADSSTGSGIDPQGAVEHFDGGSVRSGDLEKGSKGLTAQWNALSDRT